MTIALGPVKTLQELSKLDNIRNTQYSYQQLASLYQQNENKLFENIPIEITGWFSANMASALGAVLDKLTDGLNSIVFLNVEAGIKQILQKNDFLSYYGYTRMKDNYSTTIR